jgi:hypothetical protein
LRLEAVDGGGNYLCGELSCWHLSFSVSAPSTVTHSANQK